MHTRYDALEFDSVEYMASSGGLSCPDSDARNAYNLVAGFPQLEFNGGQTISGAGTDAINGSVYDPVVRSLLDDPTPLAMRISAWSFAAGSAFVTVDLELEEPLADISLTRLRVALIEDKVTYGTRQYDNILRDMLPDEPLSISQPGQTQQVTINFTMDPAWNDSRLRAVAFVQDDHDRTVLQSANTRPVPSYSLRYYVQGARTVITSGTHAFGQTGLFNTGVNPDTWDVTLDTAALPAGWSAHLEIGGNAVGSASIPLAPGGRALLNVVVDAASTGDGSVVLNLHSQSGAMADRQLSFKVITPDTRVLVVDDDGAFAYESLYITPALGLTGKSFAVWDRSSTAITAADLAPFDMVVWTCGFAFPTVDAGDRAAIASYLDGGGNLMISGQDIGWEMNDTGGAALAWYHTYLHANYIADDTNDMTLVGVAGDPIGDGLALTISGGDGANNQAYPDDIDPLGAGASVILTYNLNINAGIKADNGVHKVVYLAFGFEAINSPATRALLMQRIVDWMLPYAAGVDDQGLPGVLRPLANTPNPFNPRTQIDFQLATAGPVKLEIFDVRGRLVRVLEDGRREAGANQVVWDGLDQAGQQAPSGTYMCRLEAGGQTVAHKMMLVR